MLQTKNVVVAATVATSSATEVNDQAASNTASQSELSTATRDGSVTVSRCYWLFTGA